MLGLLTALGPLAIDMYLPALPQIATDLHTDIGATQRTMAVFFLGMGAGQLIYGPLSDRIGRRAPLLGGIAVYVIASAGCAMATSIEMLTAMRLLQALGGCVGVVVPRAVVRDRYEPQDSMRIFSLLMLVMGISPILAPLLGGLILLGGGWRSIFWLLAGMGAVLGVITAFLLKESRPEAAATLARADNPLRSYRILLGERRVMGFVLAGAVSGAATSVYVTASPALVIGTYGVSPQAFGWVFGLNGIGLIGASQINARLAKRYPPGFVLKIANRASLAICLVMLLNAVTGFGGMWGVMVPLFFVVASLGFNQPNALAGGMAHDPLRAGSVSALMGAFHFGIGAINTTLVSIATWSAPISMGAAMSATLLIAVAIFAATRPDRPNRSG